MKRKKSPKALKAFEKLMIFFMSSILAHLSKESRGVI